MATYHVRMSIGNGGKATAHYKYIERTEKYRRNDKLYSESGHLPSWASSPKDFWDRTGAHDKRSYREIEFALPNELSREEQKKIVDDFIKDYLPDKAYTYAIHEPKSRLSEEKNPHVHIMFSERIVDDRTRDMTEEEYFKRYGISRMGNEYGGAIKDRKWTELGKGELCRLRQDIADRINEAYERNGLPCRVTAKSLDEQKREHYQKGDIEGGLLYKRVRPYRAPLETFVKHAGEIAAVGRGELDPEEVENPAARLRACQEREKVIVRDLVNEIAARNAAWEPTLEEDCAGTEKAIRKTEAVVGRFAPEDRETEVARWYEKRLADLRRHLAEQEKKRKETAETRPARKVRDFSVAKAEDRRLPDLETLPKERPEASLRALFGVYIQLRKKENELSGRTAERLAEEETDRRTGGKIAALNRELEKLSYTFRPRAEKERKRAELEGRKAALVKETLSPSDFERIYRLRDRAEDERWDYIKTAERLESQMSRLAESAGLSEERATELYREAEARLEERTEAEKPARAAAEERVEPAQPEPSKTEPQAERPAPASKEEETKKTAEPDKPERAVREETAEKAKPEIRKAEPRAERAAAEKTQAETRKAAEPVEARTPEPEARPEPEREPGPPPAPKAARKPESPDMRLLRRSIDDTERAIARAEKKMAALSRKTEVERLEEHVDKVSGGRLTALRKAEEEEIRRSGDSIYTRNRYARERQIVMNANVTAALRKEVRRDAERDARRVRGLAKYVRAGQGGVIRWRAALARYEAERRMAELRERLAGLQKRTETDFLRHAVNERTEGALARLEKRRDGLRREPPEDGKALKRAEEACEAFFEAHLSPAIRTRADELAEANRTERRKLEDELRRLSEKSEIRAPFASRYREEREKLLAEAAKRRAFLYEDKALRLGENPNSIRYYCDRIINEKTDGALDRYRDQYRKADAALKRIEAEKEYVRDEGRETLAVWKDVWEKPPLRPIRGRGRKADAEALKKERQTAAAAVEILRKDFAQPEIWTEAGNRLKQKQLDQQRRRDAARILREKIRKEERRKRQTAAARRALGRAARIVDKILGAGGRGQSMGASLRVANTSDNELSGD